MLEMDFVDIIQKIAGKREKNIFLEPKNLIKNEFKTETNLLSTLEF